jgi:hypothetical protein
MEGNAPAATEPPTAEHTRDDSAPKRWIVTTPPFEVARHYAQATISNEQIKARLNENGIDSLKALKDSILDLGIRWRKGEGGKMVNAITAARLRSPEKPTEKLGGQSHYDKSCITAKSLSYYTPSAVSFSRSRRFEDETKTDVRMPLVMGPSGSGKTMFCLEYLPLAVFPASKMEHIFRVHIRAFTLLGDYDENNPKPDLPESLVKVWKTLF